MIEAPIVKITVAAAAESLGVRVDEIYRLIRSKRLRAVKYKGKWMIDGEAIMRRLSSGRIGVRREAKNGR